MLGPNNNRGKTYQTDEKTQHNMVEYSVGVVNSLPAWLWTLMSVHVLTSFFGDW